ncbi:MAG TPA: protein kinase, partial [Planctomycetota bacterium]|nr:protein kinase [Planctomycetota bacterium]
MKTCARCGREVESDLNGLCPKCIFAFAVDETEAPPTIEKSGAVEQDLPGIKLLALIGQGGMGKVYRALQVGTGRTVAVKVLAPELAADKRFVERFVSEARAMGRLNHPNIVAAYDAASAGNKHYLVMEFVEGKTCEQALQQQKKRFPEELVVSIGMQAALALAHAAQHNIVHRDIKPGNLMLAKNGVLKLCDMGIAKRGDSGELGLTTIGTSIGTPLYMSPEQASGKDVDNRSDIYSLGATLYHLATGRPPFTGSNIRAVITQHLTAPVPNPRQFVPALSEAFAAVILKMLEKNTSDRYQTPAQVADEFERIQKGRAVVAVVRSKRSTMRHVRTAASSSSSKAGLVAAAAILVALGVVGLVVVANSGGRSRPAPRPSPQDTAQRPPPQAIDAPVAGRKPGIDAQIEEFWKRAEGYLSAPVDNQIREPYEILQRQISAAAASSDRARWEALIPQLIRKAHDQVLNEPWTELKGQARKAISSRQFDEAERLLETWAPRWRYFDEARQVATTPESDRMAMLKEVRFQRVKGVDDLAAQIEKLTREGQFPQAWDLYPKLKEMAEASRVEQTAVGLVRAHIGSATTGTLTQQSIERAWAIAQDIKTRAPIDPPVHRAVDEMMKSVEANFEKVIVKAEERYGQILQAFDKEFAALMLARRYRDARVQIAKILQADDPLLAPLRYESLVSLGKLLQDPAKSGPDLLEEARKFLPPPTAPIPTQSLLRDLRAVLHLEVLCLRAIDGLKDAAANPKKLKDLEHAELSKATRIAVKQADTAGLAPIKATVSVTPGGQTIDLPVAPGDEAKLGREDLLALASFAGVKDEELKLCYMMLAHFAGDSSKASEKAYGLTSDLIAHFGITPAAPAAASPP